MLVCAPSGWATRMANTEQLSILRQGVEVWNAWRDKHPNIGPDLDDANLHGADLSGANLHRANLSGVNLHRAHLSRANFYKADLTMADLNRARLYGADLSGANLYETSFVDLDLSGCKGLENCLHSGPSIIDVRTLQRSGPLPLAFLRGVGLPDRMIEYLPSILEQAIQLYSCFISYSSKDEAFVQRLHADLQNKGVRCWFAPEDMKIGDRIGDTIDTAIRLRDKLLLVLSETSVTSAWVLKEVRTALAEEEQHGRPVLFPIRLDDAVMDTTEQWAHDIRRDRQERDQLGRARAKARGQADQCLEPEAEDHGRHGQARGQQTPGWRGRDGRRLPGRVRSGQARARCRRQAAVRSRCLHQRRSSPAQDQAPSGQGFRKGEIRKLMAEHLASTSRLVTDGLRCWTAATEAGIEHTAMVTGSGKQAARWSPFNWVNTTLGNVKAAITGTYRRISPDHAGR